MAMTHHGPSDHAAPAAAVHHPVVARTLDVRRIGPLSPRMVGSHSPVSKLQDSRTATPTYQVRA